MHYRNESNLAQRKVFPRRKRGFRPVGLRFRPQGLRFRPAGLRFRPQGLRFRPVGLRFRPQGLRFRPVGLRFRPQGLRFRPVGLRFRPQGLRFRPVGLRFRPVGLRFRPVGLRFRPQGLRFRPVGLRFKPVGLRSSVFVFGSSFSTHPIFHRRLNDLFLLRRRVITWLDTAADEAWAQGQISRYPGWYSQLMYITYPNPGVFHEYFRARPRALQCYQRRRDPSKSMTSRKIKDQRAAKVQVLFRDQLNLIEWIF